MAEQIKIFTLDNLTYYDGKIKEFVESKVAAGDAVSFKEVTLVDGVLKFYTEKPISENAVPAREIELPEQDLSHLMALVADATKGNVAVFGDNGQVVNSEIVAANIAMKSEVEAVDAKADANAEAITAINDEETGILKQAKDHADSKDEAIEAAQAAADAAQADVDNLELLVGVLPEGATATDIVGYVQEKTAGIATSKNLEELTERVAQAETDIDNIEKDYLKAADKEALQGNIDAVSDKADEIDGKVTTLIGEDANKSVRTIANEELAKQLIAEGAKESLDTLAEIAAWIQSHPDDASAMNKAIEDLEALVGALPEGITATTVVGYIQEVVAAEKAAREEVEAGFETRIKALEDKTGTGEGSVTEQIADAKEEATKHADDLNTAMDARMVKVEADQHTHSNKDLLDTYTQTEENLADAVAKKHEHANAAELAKIADGDVAKWNAAEGNANEYTDQAVETINGTIDGINDKIGEVAENKTVVEMITDSMYDDTEVKADVAKNAGDISTLTQEHATDKAALEAADTAAAGRLDALEEKVGEGFTPITTGDIDLLFA